MERAEKVGLGVAVAGHAALFGLLSLGFLATPIPLKLKQQPVEVSLVAEVATESTAPKPAEAAQSVAPEVGTPEEAAAPEPVEAPPAPKPAPAPPPQPAPQPKPQLKPESTPEPRPAPKPAPLPKPEPPRPAPPKPAPATKPAPSKPAPAKAAPAKPVPTTGGAAKLSARPAASAAKPTTAARGSGASTTASAAKPRGGRLGNDFLKGLTDQPSRSTDAAAAPATKMGTQQAANIASAIIRQVQPCANRQVTPGPGAERIRVTINLRLRRDGSLAARPTVTGHAGVDDENERYVARVDDLAVATFVGCSPLAGLPPELYDVQNGWSNFSLRYKLPG